MDGNYVHLKFIDSLLLKVPDALKIRESEKFIKWAYSQNSATWKKLLHSTNVDEVAEIINKYKIYINLHKGE